MAVIYKIRFIDSDRFYIGSAIDFGKRKSCHLSSLRKNRHRNIQLQKAFLKYGEEQIVFEIIENVEDVSFLVQREQHWIDKYDFGLLYNICNFAGNTYGRKHTSQTKLKISIMHHDVKGDNNPMYGAAGEKSPNYGKKRTIETKRKISKALKNRIPWNKGSKRPDHSERMTGENNPFYGKKHSQDTKEKMKESRRISQMSKGGKKLTLEVVREIRQRYNTEKISISALAREYGLSRNYCSKLLKGEHWNE
jgi:group I intron endonuclease